MKQEEVSRLGEILGLKKENVWVEVNHNVRYELSEQNGDLIEEIWFRLGESANAKIIQARYLRFDRDKAEWDVLNLSGQRTYIAEKDGWLMTFFGQQGRGSQLTVTKLSGKECNLTRSKHGDVLELENDIYDIQKDYRW